MTAWREGYGRGDLGRDLFAGLTVAIVALPLAMAIAVASGASPEKGLHTAVIAGFLISALGGSRFQIGGPTGAFIPVVYAVILRHGYDGLVLATLMAGLLLMAAGFARLGTLMKYMPQPLITGFTAGIAVIIFTSQLRDLLGLQLDALPAEFLPKLAAIAGGLGGINPWALGLAVSCIVLIVVLRRIAPTAPGFLVAVVAASAAVAVLDLPVATIGSTFGALPTALPAPALPRLDLDRLVALLPDAFTIAFLAGVESLLSAVVADGMTGRRHRSNMELVAQGAANCASALFGGLPATGAIARTATNIRAGARTPMAGIFHALFLLAFLLVGIGLLAFIPLAALAGVLAIVAFNMSEHERFRRLLGAPGPDRAVLLTTFLLTVLVDLTLAIQVGVLMAALFFMGRMAAVVEMNSGTRLFDDPEDELKPDPAKDQRQQLPPGVEVFQINGPLFFGVTNRLDDVLDQFYRPPRVFILRLRLVPIIDASGVHALQSLAERCTRRNIRLILSGLQPGPRAVLARLGFGPVPGRIWLVPDFAAALELAGKLTDERPGDTAGPGA